MREHGIETTDPEQELASRNKARETSLTNQIADLEKEIRTGEKPAQTGKVVPDSEAVKQLKARRDALKSKLQDIHDSDPANIAAEQKAKLESRQAAVQRNIDLIKSKLAGTAEAKKGADINRPAHPELEPLMQERDALREKLAESRKKPEAQKEEEAMQRRLEIINDTINARNWTMRQ
jgi:DNA repair exonuclease SbcCD ATPase subunit